MATVRRVAAPPGLGAAGVSLWRSIAGQWSADSLTPDARERRLLADACAEADLLAALESEVEAAMASGGLLVKGSRGQPVVHPLAAECRASRAQIAALLSKLGFIDSTKPGAGRGSRTTSTSARAAVMHRYQ